MTLCAFESMKPCEQLDLLQAEGVYIGKRKVRHLSLLVYQLEDFYIELYYSHYRRTLKDVRCFTSTLDLDPYLEDILIEDVVL